MITASVITQVVGVIGVLVFLVLLPSYGAAKLAERKGRSFALWLGFCVVVSWPILLIAVLVIRPTTSD